MSFQSPVSMQDILNAQARIRDFVRHTPLERSIELSRQTSGEVYLINGELTIDGQFQAARLFQSSANIE